MKNRKELNKFEIIATISALIVIGLHFIFDNNLITFIGSIITAMIYLISHFKGEKFTSFNFFKTTLPLSILWLINAAIHLNYILCLV